MLKGFFTLLVFQLAGETIAAAIHLPVPGPVLGLIGLIAVMLAGRSSGRLEAAIEPTSTLSRASDGLLANLGLLFVPAGVGVMQQGALIASQGPALLVVLVASTVLTLVVTVGVFLGVSRLLSAEGR